jgi:hypothetical protein
MTALSTPIKTERTRPWPEVADALEQALEAACQRGARINPNSRLRVYVKRMRQEGASSLVGIARDQISQIRCEVDEVVSALDHLRREPEVDGWARLMERVQAGPVLQALHYDPARAAQVELAMAGAMRAAGAEVSFREPDDAIATVSGHVVHFEAKRPNSVDGLGKAVRQGRKQLARSGDFGALFVDFNQLVTDVDLIEAGDHDDAHRQIVPELRSSLDGLSARVPECTRSRWQLAPRLLSLHSHHSNGALDSRSPRLVSRIC